jgi:hypothetical protein
MSRAVAGLLGIAVVLGAICVAAWTRGPDSLWRLVSFPAGGGVVVALVTASAMRKAGKLVREIDRKQATGEVPDLSAPPAASKDASDVRDPG